MKYSKTYIAVAAIVVAWCLKHFGIDIDSKDPELVAAVSDALTLLGSIVVLVERFRKGGVKWHGVKK